ncbi:MAG TPA: hypothetical protein VLU25_18385 [Acidobacteriota bacterium]|nr:hypothetical protein [Acidobacteriota bacterium]
MSEGLSLSVLKLGGSVLRGHDDYQAAADHLAARRKNDPQRRLLVVVSAQQGHTDRLLRQASRLQSAPDADALDLLWATGELRSVALLTLALRARRQDVCGLNVHQCGLQVECAADPGRPAGGPQQAPSPQVTLRRLSLLRWLRRHPLVIVPGFLAVAPGQGLRTLGRGGSDWSALLLAAALKADACELVKDVPGYFDRDPKRFPEALPLARLTFDKALQMADEGCDLVQRQALESARRFGLDLLVRSLHHEAASTLIRN